MTSTAPGEPSTEGLSVLARVQACLETVAAGLDGLPQGVLTADGSPVEGLICGVVAAERQLGELRLRLMAVADEQAEAAKVAASSTGAWLAALTGTRTAVMAGGLGLARSLAGEYESVRVAFARGELSEEQARVIVKTADQVPADVRAST